MLLFLDNSHLVRGTRELRDVIINVQKFTMKPFLSVLQITESMISRLQPRFSLVRKQESFEIESARRSEYKGTVRKIARHTDDQMITLVLAELSAAQSHILIPKISDCLWLRRSH